MILFKVVTICFDFLARILRLVLISFAVYGGSSWVKYLFVGFGVLFAIISKTFKRKLVIDFIGGLKLIWSFHYLLF